ncbi:reverse transcriptase domain-containing protein [Tanacetum coccineum]
MKADDLITILTGEGSIRIHIEQRIAAMMDYRGGRLEGDEEKLDDVFFELESSHDELVTPYDVTARNGRNKRPSSTSGFGTLPGNTVTNPKEDLKGITTRSGVTIQGPKAFNHDTEVTKDTMPPANNGSTEDVQPPVVQIQTRNPNPEPNVAPVVTPVPKASIPFPSRRNDERRKEKANDQIEKFYEIFRDLSFEISFTDALMLMPKFATTLKTLIGNKEKLSELARTPLNENCSAVILNKLPKKLGDPGRFLIPCEFTGITTCNALADLGASINLMPYSVWKSLSLPELTPTCMTLELADRSITEPIGIAEDVFVNVGKFQFPADFVVVDFEPDPRVPLILGRCFLKTSHALIDVYEGEITLRVGKEAITFNLDQTSKYTADYNHMTVNKIDVIDMACDEYSQEVLGFSNVIASGNPTPYFEPIVSTASPNLTPFGDSDFLLFEEADSFLALEDDPTSSEVDPTYQDPEGDILLLEAILNSEPPPPLPNHEQYMPGGRKELKLCEAKTVESSVDEPPEVELKELPPHLEYAFLEGDDKLPVIIAKDLKDEEKAALLKVLKSHKRAIAWKLSDIKGVSPEFCTHKILMEEDYEPSVQSQRRVNPKIHDVIKKEVEKLLDAGLIYPISDSPWVSPVHCVPKKGGMTVITNDENELIPTRLVTGWRVCIDYRKLNEATRKDHFPLPFMDQMLERLAGNEYYCFLDGFSGYFQIPIDPKDQEKTTFTCPYGTFAYRRMPFGLCNAPGTFQRCMMAIFHDMIEKTMEVFMDDFSVFGDSFSTCLSHLEKMLKRCEDTNLSLNWEKSHFMVKEGIVLGHKISKSGLEVDRAKVEVIAKLPHPTSVKGDKTLCFRGKKALDILKACHRGTYWGHYGAIAPQEKVMLKIRSLSIVSPPHIPKTYLVGSGDDALWGLRTAYKPIAVYSIEVVYGSMSSPDRFLSTKPYVGSQALQNFDVQTGLWISALFVKSRALQFPPSQLQFACVVISHQEAPRSGDGFPTRHYPYAILGRRKDNKKKTKKPKPKRQNRHGMETQLKDKSQIEATNVKSSQKVTGKVKPVTPEAPPPKIKK